MQWSVLFPVLASPDRPVLWWRKFTVELFLLLGDSRESENAAVNRTFKDTAFI